MRIERVRTKTGGRWAVQTTASVDRALAVLLIGVLVVLGHLLGVNLEIPRLLGP